MDNNKIFNKDGGIIYIKVLNNWLISYSREKYLTVYDINENFNQIKKFCTIDFIKIKFLDNYMITFNKEIQVFDINNMNIKYNISSYDVRINSIKIYKNYIISSYEDKTIKIYNINNNFILEKQIDLFFVINRFKIINNYLFACSINGINIYKILDNLDFLFINSFDIPSIKLRSYNNYIFALSDTKKKINIFIYDINEKFNLINSIQENEELEFFLTKKNYLLISTKYKTKLYNIINNLDLEKILCHDKMIINYALITNRLFITCSEEKIIIIYDKEHDFKIIKILREHVAPVNYLCINDNLLLSCSDDHYICIFDLNKLYLDCINNSSNQNNIKKIITAKKSHNNISKINEVSKYDMDQFKIYYNKNILILEKNINELEESIRYTKNIVIENLKKELKKLISINESNKLLIKENKSLEGLKKDDNKIDFEYKNNKLDIYYNNNSKLSIIKKIN